MQLINGRTAAQWRAYDRAHLVVAFLIALLLFFLWLAERGPWTAAACCGVPDARAGAAAAAVPAQPVSAPTATAAAVAPAPAPTVDPACAEALPAKALFASNGTDLTADDRAALDRIARCLGDRHLEVGGHADSSGPAGTNERLGEERARTVADYLARAASSAPVSRRTGTRPRGRWPTTRPPRAAPVTAGPRCARSKPAAPDPRIPRAPSFAGVARAG